MLGIVCGFLLIVYLFVNESPIAQRKPAVCRNRKKEKKTKIKKRSKIHDTSCCLINALNLKLIFEK